MQLRNRQEVLEILDTEPYVEELIQLQASWAEKDRGTFVALHNAYKKVSAKIDRVFVPGFSLLLELNEQRKTDPDLPVLSEAEVANFIVTVVNNLVNGNKIVRVQQTSGPIPFNVRMGLPDPPLHQTTNDMAMGKVDMTMQ